MRKVRWGTDYEDSDCDELMRSSDDFAIWLDRNGWQIVMKAECVCESNPEESKWMMHELTDACPEWALDPWTQEATPPGVKRRRVGYEPYPEKTLKH